jgi:hypothetical protein
MAIGGAIPHQKERFVVPENYMAIYFEMDLTLVPSQCQHFGAENILRRVLTQPIDKYPLLGTSPYGVNSPFNGLFDLVIFDDAVMYMNDLNIDRLIMILRLVRDHQSVVILDNESRGFRENIRIDSNETIEKKLPKYRLKTPNEEVAKAFVDFFTTTYPFQQYATLLSNAAPYFVNPEIFFEGYTNGTLSENPGPKMAVAFAETNLFNRRKLPGFDFYMYFANIPVFLETFDREQHMSHRNILPPPLPQQPPPPAPTAQEEFLSRLEIPEQRSIMETLLDPNYPNEIRLESRFNINKAFEYFDKYLNNQRKIDAVAFIQKLHDEGKKSMLIVGAVPEQIDRFWVPRNYVPIFVEKDVRLGGEFGSVYISNHQVMTNLLFKSIEEYPLINADLLTMHKTGFQYLFDLIVLDFNVSYMLKLSIPVLLKIFRLARDNNSCVVLDNRTKGGHRPQGPKDKGIFVSEEQFISAKLPQYSYFSSSDDVANTFSEFFSNTYPFRDNVEVLAHPMQASRVFSEELKLSLRNLFESFSSASSASVDKMYVAFASVNLFRPVDPVATQLHKMNNKVDNYFFLYMFGVHNILKVFKILT